MDKLADEEGVALAIGDFASRAALPCDDALPSPARGQSLGHKERSVGGVGSANDLAGVVDVDVLGHRAAIARYR